MNVVATGSQNWRDQETIEDALGRLPADARVAVGDLPGAERLIAWTCGRLSIPYTVHKTDWRHFGERARVVRNMDMLSTWPDLVLVFHHWPTPGTRHFLEEADRMGIPARLVLSYLPSARAPS